MTVKDVKVIVDLLSKSGIQEELPNEDTLFQVWEITGCVFPDEVYKKISLFLQGKEFAKWGYEEYNTLLAIPPILHPDYMSGIKEGVYRWPDGILRQEKVNTRFTERPYDCLTDDDRERIGQVHIWGFYSPKISIDDKQLSHQVLQSEADVAIKEGKFFETYYDRQKYLAELYGVTPRGLRNWINRMNLLKRPIRSKEQIMSDGTDLTKALNRERSYAKYHIVTSAQNNTPVHPALWLNILKFKDFLQPYGGCDIHVVPIRYHNPTSVLNDAASKQSVWDDCLIEYLDLTRHRLNDGLVLMADIKTQPTASYPLQSVQSLSGENCFIIGHPKQQLHTYPVLEGRPEKYGWTTGSVTSENYTDTVAGKKGEYCHRMGFLMVEVDGLKSHVRHVECDADGNFTDLIFNVDGQGVKFINESTAITLGDLHAGEHDPSKLKSSYTLCNALKPHYIICHDVWNGSSVNHHEQNNPFSAYANLQAGKNLVGQEKQVMFNLIREIQREVANSTNSEIVVVRSNHDEWVDKWLVQRDWKSDIANSKEYLYYAMVILEGKAEKGIIPFIIQEEFKDIICLGINESFMPLGCEYGNHGHLGTNGSKGTVMSYANYSTPVTIGHYHATYVLNNMHCVGTSTKKRLHYSNGPSSGSQSDSVEHLNGQRQMIIYQDTDKSFTTYHLIPKI